METPPKAEAFTEETTKLAAQFVETVQEFAVFSRELNHPIQGLQAKTLEAIVSLQHTAWDARNMSLVFTMGFLLSRNWLIGLASAVFTAFFYFQHKRATKDAETKKASLVTATDEYMNAEVRLQVAPAASATALRLAQLPKDQVVFIDAQDKEWTANELMQLVFRNEGNQTVLQFLLSCAVFGFPLGNEDQKPLNELNLKNLKALRSTTTWAPRPSKPDEELPN